MSHFTCVVTLSPDTLEEHEPPIDRGELQSLVEEQLRPYKEVGWGSDITPAEEDLHWRVYENFPHKTYDKREYESKEELNEAEDELPPVIDIEGGSYGTITTDRGEEVDRFEVYPFNPRAKWDWFQIGGRWRGMWPERPVEEWEGDPSNLYSRQGESSWTNAGEGRTGVDIATRGVIDFEAMMEDGEETAQDVIDEFWPIEEKFEDLKPLEHFRQDPDIEQGKAGDAYRAQSGVKEMEDRLKGVLFEDDVSLFLWQPNDFFQLRSHGPEKYRKFKRRQQITPYSMVHEGEWYAKGEMGWFGVSDDTIDTEYEFVMEASDVLLNLDPEAVLVNVDCHI